MLRNFGEVIALFALPFIVYFAVALARGRPLFTFEDGRGHLPRLVLAGLISAALGILALGFFEDRTHGNYIPAHYENGTLIPGRLE